MSTICTMDIPETDQATDNLDRLDGPQRTLSVFKSPPEIATLLVFVVLAILGASFSDGFVTADACTHYLFAKYAFSDPVNFVDVWGRPLCTLIDSLPAHFGNLFLVR